MEVLIWFNWKHWHRITFQITHHSEIEVFWQWYASVGWAINAPGNSLLPVRCQAINWTNIDLISHVPPETKFSIILNKISHFFFQENACENVVWNNMSAIAFRHQYAKNMGFIGRAIKCKVNISLKWFGMLKHKIPSFVLYRSQQYHS